MKSRPTQHLNILFLCVANSARSQLAEALAKNIFGSKARIESAGSEPSGKVQPWAVAILRESGIDASKNWSKSIKDLNSDFLENLDYVVTLCDEEVCPVFISQAIRLHWPIPDPAKVSEEAKEKAFRDSRDEIRLRLIGWSQSLFNS